MAERWEHIKSTRQLSVGSIVRRALEHTDPPLTRKNNAFRFGMVLSVAGYHFRAKWIYGNAQPMIWANGIERDAYLKDKAYYVLVRPEPAPAPEVDMEELKRWAREQLKDD